MCKAIQDMMDESRQEGAEKEKISNIRNFMSSMNMSAEAVMDALKIPQEQQEKYAALL